ncbi:MAG TPA: WYL domain-containing protein [Actinomycetota bacterium]|nr:WYL domain-containing protein [Actinomycetota bacterium]
MYPVERLVNLVALLLEAGRPLTFDDIRAKLPEAYRQDDRGSAKRQFERDKDVLRQAGVPVDVVPTDAFEVEEGYRIRKDRYYLPEISFSAEEAAALLVAALAPGAGREAAEALRKLALGADASVLASLGEAPAVAGVDGSGGHLGSVAAAVAERRRVRFRYRPLEGEPGDREVDAWGLLFRRGAWYLVGGDRARGETRAFRLSRFASPVVDAGEAEPAPEGFRAAEHVTAGPWGLGEPETTARVAFSPKVAWWALGGVPGARVLESRDDGWTEAEVPAAAGESFVSWILSFGADAEVIAPRALRDAVVSSLEEVRAAL